MEDIVIRLRARTSELAHEAANEITTLRKYVKKLERDIARHRAKMMAPRHISNQLDSSVGGYRADDPDTSVEAAHSLGIEELKYAILTVMRDAGTPLNCSEIGDLMGVERDTVSPRFISLRNMGLVEPAGLRPGPTGRSQIAYVLTARGRAAVAQRPVEA
jgi:DNA-binding MarR family transcriptional regulator